MAHSAEELVESFRVCILCAIRFYRDGLALLLESAAGLSVVEAAPPTMEAVKRVLAIRPDVVLVDVSNGDGVAAMHYLREAATPVEVVAVAVSERDAAMHECARAGVGGYVTSDASSEELTGILKSVARGELRCPAPLSAVLRQELASNVRSTMADQDHSRLTTREREILNLVRRNLSNKEIAGCLTIEVSTVKSHVHSILEKLHVRRRADAVICAFGRYEPDGFARGAANSVRDDRV